MNKSLFLKSALVAASASLLATGCVVRERVRYEPAPPPPVYVAQPAPAPGPPPPPEAGEVAVPDAPPPPIVESVTVAPDPAFIWIGGIWAWHGRWVWEPGHWDRPPRRGARWAPAHFVVRGGRRFWVGGRWR